MKKSVLMFSMTTLLLIGGMNISMAQEQPKPKKDTVNMDTDAKPQFYYAVEDDKIMPEAGSNKTTEIIVIVAGVVVIVGAVGFFLFKKKK